MEQPIYLLSGQAEGTAKRIVFVCEAVIRLKMRLSTRSASAIKSSIIPDLGKSMQEHVRYSQLDKRSKGPSSAKLPHCLTCVAPEHNPQESTVYKE